MTLFVTYLPVGTNNNNNNRPLETKSSLTHIPTSGLQWPDPRNVLTNGEEEALVKTGTRKKLLLSPWGSPLARAPAPRWAPAAVVEMAPREVMKAVPSVMYSPPSGGADGELAAAGGEGRRNRPR